MRGDANIPAHNLDQAGEVTKLLLERAFLLRDQAQGMYDVRHEGGNGHVGKVRTPMMVAARMNIQRMDALMTMLVKLIE